MRQAGGLIGPGNPDIPGTIPTIQQLIQLLFSLVSPQEMTTLSSSVAVVEAESRPIEDGVNAVLFAATAASVRIVELAAPLVAPILGMEEEEAAGFLALGTVGLFGPLISGTGAAGHAFQDLVDSDSFANFVDNSLDLVRLPIDGAVNGGFGPNLAPVIGDFIPAPLPISDVRAGGLINEVELEPVIDPDPTPHPALAGKFQGTIPTLRGLVTQVLAPEEMVAESGVSRANDVNNLSATTDEEKVAPKKYRPLLNVVKRTLGTNASNENASPAKHRLGIGKTPVRDLVKRVLGGGLNKDKDKDKDKKEVAKDEAAE
ncbi:hypothetical protein [Mycolicibacterium agri]|nr:hypothetical protein [Mycolicibacterium agri]